MNNHYHVVEFIQGCLNDYDSGPYETLEYAREELEDIRRWYEENTDKPYKPAGADRYESGVHVLKIEECNEEDCSNGL